MSNRQQNRQVGSKGFPKTQTKYVPKTPNTTTTEPATIPTPNTSLSSSRQSFSRQSDATASASGSVGGGSASRGRGRGRGAEPSATPTPNPNSNSNPNPTLSSSLRQSFSRQSDPTPSASSSDGGGSAGRGRGRGRGEGASVSRVRMDESGDWVSGRVQGGHFVNYLPQDEAVAAGLSAEEGGLDPVESQRVVDLLNRELSRLLKLSPRDFWREVAADTSLHDFLDSFLKFRSRWYDFPHHGAKGIVAGVIVGEFELSRRVFMVLYCISSNRGPGTRASDSLSTKDHSVLLQERKLLDLPKLIDICAIYGHQNEDLTRLLVVNSIKAQPGIHENLTAVASHFLNIVSTMHQRCSSSLETLFSSGGYVDPGSSRLHADFLEVMDFINDAVVSMDAFVSAYKPAAVFFSCPIELSNKNEELINTLARLHDSLLPSLLSGFRVIYAKGEHSDIISNIVISVKMLSSRIVKLGSKLLDFCYLSDEVVKISLPFPLPDSTMMFPSRIEDPVIRSDILVQAFRELSIGLENQNLGTFLQNAEKNLKIMSRLETLRSTGWISMDDEQFWYLSEMLRSSKTIVSKLSNPVTRTEVQIDEDTIITESKISQIKDLFPEYGKGFLSACLEVYNHNPEEVIQRILEGTLHADLKSLNTSLETVPPRKSAPPVNKNDKGKGKIVEDLPLIPSETHDSSGRFVRKSKSDLPDLRAHDSEASLKTATLISQYEYEDEYDDSFDDLGLSVGDSGVEETDKIGSNFGGKDWGEENGGAPSNASKWGSRKTPQFYVKDGKNYSYKVAGSVAVANSSEAYLVNQAQRELIHGLGRGGNLPLGAVKKLTESYDEEEEEVEEGDGGEVGGRGNPGSFRGGRGRRGGGGRKGGGGRSSYRKDMAMRKHFFG